VFIYLHLCLRLQRGLAVFFLSTSVCVYRRGLAVFFLYLCFCLCPQKGLTVFHRFPPWLNAHRLSAAEFRKNESYSSIKSVHRGRKKASGQT